MKKIKNYLMLFIVTASTVFGKMAIAANYAPDADVSVTYGGFYRSYVSSKTIPELMTETGIASLTSMKFQQEKDPMISQEIMMIQTMELHVPEGTAVTLDQLKQLYVREYRPATLREVLSYIVTAKSGLNVFKNLGTCYVLDDLRDYGISYMPANWKFFLATNANGIISTGGSDNFTNHDKFLMIKKKEVL